MGGSSYCIRVAARLLVIQSDHAKCVVLSACYTETQAEATVRHIKDYDRGIE